MIFLFLIFFGLTGCTEIQDENNNDNHNFDVNGVHFSDLIVNQTIRQEDFLYIDIDLTVTDDNYQNGPFKWGEIEYILYADDEDINIGKMYNKCGTIPIDKKPNKILYCLEYPIKFNLQSDLEISENLKNKFINKDEINFRITGILNVSDPPNSCIINFEINK